MKKLVLILLLVLFFLPIRVHAGGGFDSNGVINANDSTTAVNSDSNTGTVLGVSSENEGKGNSLLAASGDDASPLSRTGFGTILWILILLVAGFLVWSSYEAWKKSRPYVEN